MNINNGNNNLGFNKKTSDKKVLKKLEDLEKRVENVENLEDIDLNLDNYITKDELDNYITKDELERKNYLTQEDMAFVNEFVTDAEVRGLIEDKADKIHEHSQYLTEIPSEYATETYVKNEIANIPKEEIDLTDYALKTDIPTKTSELTNDSGFITKHQSLDEYAKKEDLFSRNYNDLTNKPTIPSIKGLATETYVKNEIANIQLGGNDNYINVLDYGVKEGLDVDAKTNTTAFQSILDTYGDTKIILFPPGNFIFNPVDLREQRNITIEGFSSSFASFSQKNIYTGKITDTFTKIICAKNTDATFFKHKNCVLVMRNLGFYNVLINGTSFDLQTPAKTNVFMQHTVTDGAGNNVEKGKAFITDCAFFGWKVVFGNGFTMQHLEDEWGTGKSESKYDFFKQSCVMANRCRFTKNGVGVNQSVDARLIDCSFNKNDYGIVFRKNSGFSSVIGCRIEWNNYNGIYVKEAHDVTISECEFDCNGYAGLYVEGNTNSNFNNNVYRRNGAKIENTGTDYINNVHIYAYNNTDCNFIGNNTLAKTTSDVGSALTRPSNCVGFDSNINCIISMNNFQGCTKSNKLDGSLIKNNVNCVIVNNIPNIVQK
jgi:parallel beta-helix repeat protein